MHRTIVSNGLDEALGIVGEFLPDSASYFVETYTPGESAWTWKVPNRYHVHEAYLETVGGQRIVDFVESPLHIVSYSIPVDLDLTWEELEPHLHYSSERPHTIPWIFKYYDRDWGFCLSKNQFDKLPREQQYHAVIRAEFLSAPDQGLRNGIAVVHPEGGPRDDAGEILVCSHICHPSQANDDAAGVAVAVEVARRLAEKPLPSGSMSVRFLFCPETIGSICYLSHNEDLIPRFAGGIFVEMPGNRNSIALQRSRQDDHLIDRVARSVLRSRVDEFREGAYLSVVRNDEKVINGPGVNIPCISLSRWPYEEYHTSDDNLDIIHEDMLVEIADVVEETIRIFATNYVPQRSFRGPVFLSRYGLWVDWRTNWDLSLAQDRIMVLLEGGHSIYDIAEEVKLDYWQIRDFLEKFREQDLVRADPIPRISEAL